MYSLQEFKQLKNPDCDYIVTTERILKADFPIIYISMALPEREMQKIKEGIKEIQVNHLLELNILEAIILPIEEKNMESAVKAMVQPLLEEDFVTEEYLQSVLEREEMSSTSLNHIALPHGNPAMVQNTRLVIGRMNHPILWDDSKVSCAFLFAVSSEMLKEKPMLFNTFYRTMADPEVEESIKKLQMEKNLPDEVFRQKLFQILR
jgi:mannitol/fructose-specific phosphotransferase system IIA component (Ntr-type)